MKSTKPSISLIDNIFILRIAFLFSAQFAIYEGFQDWNRGRADSEPGSGNSHSNIYGVSIFVLAVSLMRSDVVLRFRNMPLIPFIIATLTSVYVVAEIAYNGSYRTDVLAYSQYAAIMFAEARCEPVPARHDECVADVSCSAGRPDPTDVRGLSDKWNNSISVPGAAFSRFCSIRLAWVSDMRWVLVAFEIGVMLTLYYWCSAKPQAYDPSAAICRLRPNDQLHSSQCNRHAVGLTFGLRRFHA